MMVNNAWTAILCILLFVFNGTRVALVWDLILQFCLKYTEIPLCYNSKLFS